MSARRLELLQWFGVLAAPSAWAAHLVIGLYLAEARCEASQWTAGWSSTQIALTAGAALVALLAEGAALTVYRELRHTDPDAPGPPGRQYFFAIGGLVGNVLFFVAILLTGVTVLATQACRQA
jgi:hypothetical protein